MSECCGVKENKPSAPKDAVCPVNGRRYKQVKRKTVLHHVIHPWMRSLPEQAYYYCDDPDCDLIYFGEDKTEIYNSELRLSITQRNHTVCYCFGVSKEDLVSDKQICKEFVIEQTKQSTCDCEIRNPSGKCCLKDFQ